MTARPASASNAAWQDTREEVEIPSEPSTPAATDVHASSDPFTRASTSRDRSNSAARSQNDNGHYNIDAEDEDVKIAIMALGAMKHLDGTTKHLDGTTRSRSHSNDDPMKQVRPDRSHSNTSIPSPSSSTPVTDFNSTMASSSASTTSTTSSTPVTLADIPPDYQFPAILHDENGNEVRVEREDMADADFLQRVSHLPIVRGTLRAYELGKQRSRVVRYGGDLVESSVKAISRPVVSRIGARLGDRGVEQLDDFACRQLDRIYPYATEKGLTKEEKASIMAEIDEKDEKEWKDMSEEERGKRRKAYIALRTEEVERQHLLSQTSGNSHNGEGNGVVSSPVLASLGRSTSYSSTMPAPSQIGNRLRERSTSSVHPNSALVRANSDNPASRNASWGSMLVEAGVTAGGLGAAMSEESMKSLKYCLQWLQYATAHIEHQITVLRDLIVKLNNGELDLTSPAAENLSNIKRDVVVTIRNVVDVVGKYAGGALPEPARASVKAFILSLPARWATVNRASATVEGRQGAFGGSPASPSFSPAHSTVTTPTPSSFDGRPNPSARQQAAATAVAANRVLTLAVESLDILRSVTVIFGESLDRADLWVERLRVLGLQKKRAHEQAAAEEAAARIDAGMGGAVARGGQWDVPRGMRLPGSQSPGADSNISIGTDASSKRRRVKRRGTSRSNASPARAPHGDASSSTAMESDGGSSTETEHPGHAAPTMSRNASSTGGISTALHHHAGAHAHRRGAVGKPKGSVAARVSKTPPTGSTPLFQEMSLQDQSKG